MNLKHAQYMLTVLQEGSITSAAKKLYVSQPSLSQMIKLVETNLGTPIFNRSTEPLTLTYAGEKYMEAKTADPDHQYKPRQGNRRDYPGGSWKTALWRSRTERHAGASLCTSKVF